MDEPAKVDGVPITGSGQFLCINPSCGSVWFVKCFKLQTTKDGSWITRLTALFISDRVDIYGWACVKCGTVVSQGTEYGGMSLELGR